MGSQIIENCPSPPMALALCQEPGIRVYTRREKSGKDIENTRHLEDHHASEPDIHSPETHSGLSNSNHDKVVQINDDLDFPIALRKGVRACTKHPIGNFVSYKALSPSYQAFVSVIDNMRL